MSPIHKFMPTLGPNRNSRKNLDYRPSPQRVACREPRDQRMATFDAETLQSLRNQREVTIRTAAHPKSAVIIWVVVADGDVFVRSVYGARGRWYRDLAAGGPATLEFGDRRLAVEAVPEIEPAALRRVSDEYLRKYRPSPYAEAMVKTEVLATTLRLKPR